MMKYLSWVATADGWVAVGFFVFFNLCTVNEWEGPAVIQRRPFFHSGSLVRTAVFRASLTPGVGGPSTPRWDRANTQAPRLLKGQRGKLPGCFRCLFPAERWSDPGDVSQPNSNEGGIFHLHLQFLLPSLGFCSILGVLETQLVIP